MSTRAPRPLTQNPFAGLRITGTREGTPVVTTLPDADTLAAQRQAIARMHEAARKRQLLERALYGLRFDTEGRAHDVRTGRYASKPTV